MTVENVFHQTEGREIEFAFGELWQLRQAQLLTITQTPNVLCSCASATPTPAPSGSPPYSLAGGVLNLYFIDRLKEPSFKKVLWQSSRRSLECI